VSHQNPTHPSANQPDEPGTQHLTRAQIEAAAPPPPHDPEHPATDDLVPENLIPEPSPAQKAEPIPKFEVKKTAVFPPETDQPDEPGTQHLTRADVEASEANHHPPSPPAATADPGLEDLLPDNLVTVPVVLVTHLPAPLADCWNRIGVQGDQTCRELAQHSHCHNCPTYSRAAAQFLDRPLPADYRRDWTTHFAPEKHIATPAKTSVVIFRLANEWLALPTHTFQEIAERRPMHTLPHRQHTAVLGIVNIRGELLICAALHRLLGLEAPAGTTRAVTFERLLVAEWNGHRIAFPVDEVHGVHRFHNADLRDPPALHTRSGLHCAAGIFPWRQHTVGLLDADLLAATLNRKLT